MEEFRDGLRIVWTGELEEHSYYGYHGSPEIVQKIIIYDPYGRSYTSNEATLETDIMYIKGLLAQEAGMAPSPVNGENLGPVTPVYEDTQSPRRR